MRTARVRVHLSDADVPVLAANVHGLLNVLHAVDHHLLARDVDALDAVLADLDDAGLWVEQVAHVLVVDLNVRHAHKELALAALRLDALEDLLRGLAEDARRALVAEHRVRLAAARLAVGKDRAVDAVKRAAHDRAPDLVENLSRRRLLVKHVVVRERGALLLERGAARVRLDDGAELAHCPPPLRLLHLELSSIERPEPHAHADVLHRLPGWLSAPWLSRVHAFRVSAPVAECPCLR